MARSAPQVWTPTVGVARVPPPSHRAIGNQLPRHLGDDLAHLPDAMTTRRVDLVIRKRQHRILVSLVAQAFQLSQVIESRFVSL